MQICSTAEKQPQIAHSKLYEPDVQTLLTLQVDKSWSAIAKRPFDPFLSDHGQDQVLLQASLVPPAATTC